MLGEGSKDTLEELRKDTEVWARDSHSQLPSVAGAPPCSTSPAFAPHQAYLHGSHSALPSWPQFSLFRLTACILVPATVGRRDRDAMPTYTIVCSLSFHPTVRPFTSAAVCVRECVHTHMCVHRFM